MTRSLRAGTKEKILVVGPLRVVRPPDLIPILHRRHVSSLPSVDRRSVALTLVLSCISHSATEFPKSLELLKGQDLSDRKFICETQSIHLRVSRLKHSKFFTDDIFIHNIGVDREIQFAGRVTHVFLGFVHQRSMFRIQATKLLNLFRRKPKLCKYVGSIVGRPLAVRRGRRSVLTKHQSAEAKYRK
jgi:hypothetical protein